MAKAKTTALFLVPAFFQDSAINFETADFFEKNGIKIVPEGNRAFITVQRGGLKKGLSIDIESFEDDPRGKIFRLKENFAEFFGLTNGEKNVIEFNSNTRILNIRSVGAK